MRHCISKEVDAKSDPRRIVEDGRRRFTCPAAHLKSQQRARSIDMRRCHCPVHQGHLGGTPPFLLISSIMGAIIHLYVSEDTLARMIPRNRTLGMLMACFAVMALPVCNCTTVPVVRRLLGRGVPLHVGVTVMLAVPMANLLVIFSTWFAFYQHPLVIAYRIGFGLLISIVAGLAVSVLDGKYRVVPELSRS